MRPKQTIKKIIPSFWRSDIKGFLPFSGNWKDDRRHGFGIHQIGGDSEDGEESSFYEGLWINGLRHGWGRCLERDGTKYEGGWNQGMKVLLHRYEGILKNCHGS